MLHGAVELLGRSFELDRCTILTQDQERQEIVLSAEFSREPLKPLGERRYQLRANCEWYRLLSAGRPVPLKEIRPGDGGERGGTPQFQQFIDDSDSKALVAFPIISDNRLIGCLTIHYCLEAKALSEELLELGEAVTDELALGVMNCRLLKEKDVEGRIFSDSQLPILVLEPGSCRVVRANDAARSLLGYDELSGLSLLELFAASDAKRLESAARSIEKGRAPVMITGLAARNAGGDPLMLNVSLSTFEQDGRLLIFVTLVLQTEASFVSAPAASHPATPTVRSSKIQEMVATLSKQLNWERVARHIISALHISLDRDVVLQTAVDLLGRALNAGRCLVVRTDGPVSPMVTHEYVQADIGPLGLGRTSQFPLSAVTTFKTKTTAIHDLAAQSQALDVPVEDLNYLMDSGFRALLGTPIGHHGVTTGIIVVANAEQPQHWSAQEIELLEIVAAETAMALNHAQSFAQLKDQLFHMNLLGTLTQQLTNALDLASRSGRPQSAEEFIRQPSAPPPLSLRELEVLKLIAQGLANREIAQRLFLTESTVELHASRIRKKLKLKSRTALVKYACDNHLV